MSGQRGTSPTVLRFPTAERSLTSAADGTQGRRGLSSSFSSDGLDVQSNIPPKTRKQSTEPSRGDHKAPRRHGNLVTKRGTARPFGFLVMTLTVNSTELCRLHSGFSPTIPPPPSPPVYRYHQCKPWCFFYIVLHSLFSQYECEPCGTG